MYIIRVNKLLLISTSQFRHPDSKIIEANLLLIGLIRRELRALARDADIPDNAVSSDSLLVQSAVNLGLSEIHESGLRV